MNKQTALEAILLLSQKYEPQCEKTEILYNELLDIAAMIDAIDVVEHPEDGTTDSYLRATHWTAGSHITQYRKGLEGLIMQWVHGTGWVNTGYSNHFINQNQLFEVIPR